MCEQPPSVYTQGCRLGVWSEGCWAWSARRELPTTVTPVSLQEDILTSWEASRGLVLPFLSALGCTVDSTAPVSCTPAERNLRATWASPPGAASSEPQGRMAGALLRSWLGADPWGPPRAPAGLTQPWHTLGPGCGRTGPPSSAGNAGSL